MRVRKHSGGSSVLKALRITVEVIPATGPDGRYLRAGERVRVRMVKKDEG